MKEIECSRGGFVVTEQNCPGQPAPSYNQLLVCAARRFMVADNLVSGERSRASHQRQLHAVYLERGGDQRAMVEGFIVAGQPLRQDSGLLPGRSYGAIDLFIVFCAVTDGKDAGIVTA